MTRTLLLTRARSQSEHFAAQLNYKTSLVIHIAPMQEMRDIPVEIDFAGVDALVFTSKNGVESFARRWDIRDIPAYCVGQATAECARDAGMVALAAQGNSASLSDLVIAAGVQHPLHIHGQHKAGGLPIKGQDIAIYDQVALQLDSETIDMLAAGDIDAVALFSPRSARLLADVWQTDWPQADLFCISEATAGPVGKLGSIHVSKEPSAASMLTLLAEHHPSGN